MPVSNELWAVAQLAAIILLFMAHLETDLPRFLKYAGPATVIAVGGVIVPFALGVVEPRFDHRGAWRIGVGMMPRGEVALIIASVGIAEGLIDQAVFGVAILMTIVTTMLAPMILVPAFQNGGSGLENGSDESKS